MNGSIRNSFGNALVELGRDEKRLFVLDSDVAHATKADIFEKEFPERFIQCGVAEQNTVGIAAGLAEAGLIPYVNNFAAFVSRRAHDQIFVSVAYSKLNVKICGSYCGITTPNTGASHQSIDDISVFRSLPDFVIIEPGDVFETRSAVKSIAYIDKPVYLRIARNDEQPSIFTEGYKFELGKIIKISGGEDILLIGTGIMTEKCLKAKELLKKDNIDAGVIHIPTIKPFDEQELKKIIKGKENIISIENHSNVGGLGSTLAEFLSSNKINARLLRMGIVNSFGCSGKLDDLYKKYNLTEFDIYKNALNMLSYHN